MIRRFTSVAALILSCSLNAGCASIVNGDTQSVSVVTPPVTGAICSLTNNKGEWFVNNTPGSVTIHRSYQNLIVNCQKPGYDPATQTVVSKTKAMAFGNILFGGVVGAGVDTCDGAAYNYPTVIQVPMQAK